MRYFVLIVACIALLGNNTVSARNMTSSEEMMKLVLEKNGIRFNDSELTKMNGAVQIILFEKILQISDVLGSDECVFTWNHISSLMDVLKTMDDSKHTSMISRNIAFYRLTKQLMEIMADDDDSMHKIDQCFEDIKKHLPTYDGDKGFKIM